jgi:predicted acyl esterase
MCTGGDEVVTKQPTASSRNMAARARRTAARYAEQLETTTLGRMWSRDRNTNTGGVIAGDGEQDVIAAVNHVLHGPRHRSRLVLPIIER